MPLEDKATRRLVEREIAKFPIDYSLLVVTVINGVCTFSGRVAPLRGALGRNIVLKDEVRKLADCVRMVHGVHEVVLDISYDS
jgi:osmotically-inducible protein OsmY